MVLGATNGWDAAADIARDFLLPIALLVVGFVLARRRDNSEWLRDQRLAAYAESLSGIVSTVAAAPFVLVEPTSARLAAFADTNVAAYGALIRARILGSPEVRAILASEVLPAMDELAELVHDHVESYAEASAQPPRAHPGPWPAPQSATRRRHTTDAVPEVVKDYWQAVRDRVVVARARLERQVVAELDSA